MRRFLAHRTGTAGAVVLAVAALVALVAPLLIPAEALDVTRVTAPAWQPPGARQWLGTDHTGRSVALLMAQGAGTSLFVGLTAAVLAVGIGTLVGIVSGHFGGLLSGALLRVTDFFLVLPALVLAIALSTVLPRGLGTIVLAIGLTSWPSTARVVRAQTLTIEARPFVERARALGGGHGHVIGRHVLPSVVPLVLVNATLAVASAIVAESTLAFLGLGDPTRISWGAMLHQAQLHGAVPRAAWWFLLPPGLAIVVVVLAFTLVGRALEAVVTPKR
ncbi:peptide/nickel transport system permease protein [Lentzea xinjiangensis]|uniref:Peptide/nickel transport system permease protein n=1 Tax=Lentzea xinjiangensis TaxID=402600 RepID=A0A1H9KZ89_9PSEU|nr:ABC transporter permease [Lentzea xinjiangensis]SER04207.1 peptide/nickel transport system permease protein [Lentzea xinjiangensis]